MVKFIQDLLCATQPHGRWGAERHRTHPHVNNSDHYNFRIDEQIGSRDNVFFRYDRVNVDDVRPFDISGIFANSVPALNIGVGWTHVFSSSLLMENRIGRAQRPFYARSDRYEWPRTDAGVGIC